MMPHHARMVVVTQAGPLKMRALSLDAAGERDLARNSWLAAAKLELERLVPAEGPDFRNDIGEVIACLAQACTPMPKDKARAVVARFMQSVKPRK
jgi:hypothetical protein